MTKLPKWKRAPRAGSPLCSDVFLLFPFSFLVHLLYAVRLVFGLAPLLLSTHMEEVTNRLILSIPYLMCSPASFPLFIFYLNFVFHQGLFFFTWTGFSGMFPMSTPLFLILSLVPSLSIGHLS